MYFDLTALLFLLILSGFFSSAETALFSISMTKARHLAKENGRANELILEMKESSHRLLSTILIGNNIVNVAAASLATSVMIRLFPSNAVGLATIVMTVLILVFGEIIPKSIAAKHSIPVARGVIRPIHCLSRLFYPLIRILEFIPMLTGKIDRPPTVTEEELKTIVEVVEEEGEIKEAEKEFIHNIFQFDDTSASEIMTPRADMFVIDVNDRMGLDEILKSGFTRIPVIDNDIDDVIGIVNVKDLFSCRIPGGKNPDFRKVMRKPYFVPESKKLDTLLHHFKNGKHHLAIVIDEHGGVAGIITLEDVIEEIVGEISDETDKVAPHIVRLKNREWIVLGKSSVDEINKMIPMNIPESMEYDTFSGYILKKIGRIPRENEKIKLKRYEVTVKEMDGNRIVSFYIRRTGG